MNVMAFTVALWSHDVYPSPDQGSELALSLRSLFHYLALLFSIPVLLLLGGPICCRVWTSLRQAMITTDLLIILGVVAAFVFSAISVIRGDGHTYFEVGCMVLIFVTLGRWLEERGRQQTTASLDALSKLLPDKVRLVRGDTNEMIPRRQASRGDHLRILAGERFAVDGRIISGVAEIDEQLVTGESGTIVKCQGDRVFSGTLNMNGDLNVLVTAAAGRETVSRMLDLVYQARATKGHHARLADQVATWFVPAVCLVAVTAGVVHGQWYGLDAGILTGLAVVLIACPCALGLATPLAVSTALGRAAREQVLFRSGQALEQLAAITAARFDKTGTLTSGSPNVTEFVTDSATDDHQVLRVAAALASASTHNFSAAIARELNDIRSRPQLVSTTTWPGKGVTARMTDGGGLVALGSRALMQEIGCHAEPTVENRIRELLVEDTSLAYLGWDGRIRGVFQLREELRPEAKTALEACRRANIDVAVLTGDRKQRGEQIAEQLSVPVLAELLPAEKVEALEAARQKFGRVAMIGDGLNDAPALAAANVGVAMGCGADLSRDSANVCLLSNDLSRFAWTVLLARRTVAIIRQNLFWAFAYNTVGMGLAVTGRLNPIWAALAMALSSSVVVTNSLRLGRFASLPSPVAEPSQESTGNLPAPQAA